MAEKNLVEEALIQIQNLEEAINENAKEILHSTMKEEISELVKESMKNEAEEEDEFEVEDEMGSEDESEEEDEFELEDESEEDESEEEDFEFETEEDEDSEEEFDMMNLSDMGNEDEFDSMAVTDLTDSSMEEVLKAFKEMKSDDSFEIKKEGDFIHLKDEEDEYLIQTESEEEEYEGWQEESEEETDEIVYEIEMGDEAENESVEEELDEMYGGDEHDYKRRDGHKIGNVDGHYKDYETMEEGEEEEEYEFNETVFESKSAIKPKVGKGASTGKAKFDYKKSKGGFSEKKSHANPTKGTSKPKFEFKEGEMFDMPSKTPKLSKEEAKEASRTYGTGWRDKALKKGARAGQNQARLYTESMVEELEMLKAKNEEYRKALNMFRDKLNEVAVFNSNLAYATRLFTEHSTSKQEKINVLRRFDSAETLKESKALYKTIKEELGGETKKFVTESIERVIDKAPQSGSAVNLIESKTYENPQFLRMKDIMSKIIK